MTDPVADELVASLARPDGNVTGTTFLSPELVSKRLQLLREVVPGFSRVAALWHPNAYSERTMGGIRNEIEVAAHTLGLQLQLVPAVSEHDFANAFAAMAREHGGALFVMPSRMLFGEYRRLASIAANSRLPANGGSSGIRGPRRTHFLRSEPDRACSAARHVCVQNPEIKFELVINLSTAIPRPGGSAAFMW
jgi:putative ABC transport system substrate-binding protein